jgi:hypothetical protein
MVSMLVNDQLMSPSEAMLVAPVGLDPEHPELDNHARGYSVAEVDQLIGRLLHALVAKGARTVIVEDGPARHGDPRLEGEVAFVGNRVVRWAALDANTDDALVLLRCGSSGHPLNAFVSTRSVSELTLVPGSQLRSEPVSSIVRSLVAVITSVYDAEAYVVLLTTEAVDAVL